MNNEVLSVDVISCIEAYADPPDLDLILEMVDRGVYKNVFGSLTRSRVYFQDGSRFWHFSGALRDLNFQDTGYDIGVIFLSVECKFDSTVSFQSIDASKFQHVFLKSIQSKFNVKSQKLIRNAISSRNFPFFPVGTTDVFQKGSVYTRIYVGAVTLLTAIAHYPELKEGVGLIYEDARQVSTEIHKALRASVPLSERPRDESERSIDIYRNEDDEPRPKRRRKKSR